MAKPENWNDLSPEEKQREAQAALDYRAGGRLDLLPPGRLFAYISNALTEGEYAPWSNIEDAEMILEVFYGWKKHAAAVGGSDA